LQIDVIILFDGIGNKTKNAIKKYRKGINNMPSAN
jgi:hypothetical protein